MKDPFGPWLHLGTGQEVIPTVLGSILRKDDFVMLHYRMKQFLFIKGIPLGPVIAGYIERLMYPDKDSYILDFDLQRGLLGHSSSLGEDVPIYTGAAMAAKIKKEDKVAVCCFGDGTSNRGPVHESLNMASAWKLPIVFVVDNNQYAISMPIDQAMGNTNIADRAIGYGMPGVRVDGTDVLAAYEVMLEAVKRARSGKGPSLVVVESQRLGGHNIGDPQVYRPKGELEELRKTRDPFPIYREALLKKKILTEEVSKKMEEEVKNQLEEAVAYAKSMPFPKIENLLKKAIE